MNIKKLLVGHAIRLKYVSRFSTCRTLHKESVAEHVFFTTLYSLVVGEWIERTYDININFRKLLSRAILHDLEECITGDIPRDFKHMDADLNKHINEMAEQGFQKVIESLFQFGSVSVWTSTWKNAKDDSIEGKILAFADFLSVVSYVYEETRIAKSLVLKEQLTSMGDYCKAFAAKKYKMFWPLVTQVHEIVFGEILNESE